MKRLAVYQGTFDPPGLHHRRTAELLAGQFDEVLIVPAGRRPDRPEAESYPVHRAIMADLNFRGLPGVRVELSDLERDLFTPNHEFDVAFGGPGVVISHVVPCAAVAGGTTSKLYTEWTAGPDLWRTAHFTILRESGEPLELDELPPRNLVVDVPPLATTALIRSQLFDGSPADGLLVPAVADYIRRHGLFRPTPPARECVVRFPNPKIRLCYDSMRPESLPVVEALRRYEHPEPELIVAVGGDGTMLRAIRQYWRDRLPFFGINTGHIGFLLNDRARLDVPNHNLRLYQLPLLWVELTGTDEVKRTALAFNDCWVERETGQTAWLEVAINGSVRMPRVVADGMLLSTAAGSTSYARAMGATPLPFNAPLLTLAGSNVLKPEFWHPAVLTSDSEVRVRSLDPDKRPLRGFIDGVSYGPVTAMTARVSNIAAVELLFAEEHDPVAKLAVLQFPQPR